VISFLDSSLSPSNKVIVAFSSERSVLVTCSFAALLSVDSPCFEFQPLNNITLKNSAKNKFLFFILLSPLVLFIKKAPKTMGAQKTFETNAPDIACSNQSTLVSDFATCITVERGTVKESHLFPSC